ncbi:MAG: hypothetical protein ACRC62_00865 [Microcoleus sp.]
MHLHPALIQQLFVLEKLGRSQQKLPQQSLQQKKGRRKKEEGRGKREEGRISENCFKGSWIK